MVSLGQLRVHRGIGGTRYEAGAPLAGRDAVRGEDGFWSELTRRHPGISYLRLSRLGGRFHLRAQAQALVKGLSFGTQLIVDFRGVTSISAAFASELFIALARRGYQAEPINASPAVEETIDRALALERLRALGG